MRGFEHLAPEVERRSSRGYLTEFQMCSCTALVHMAVPIRGVLPTHIDFAEIGQVISSHSCLMFKEDPQTQFRRACVRVVEHRFLSLGGLACVK